MKRAAKDPRKIELAKIHMGASSLGLIRTSDDSAYRDMLWSVARVHSAKDLDREGRERVLAHLRACGWRDTNPPRRKALRPQPGLIRHLWDALHGAGVVQDGGPSALRAWVRRQTVKVHPAKEGYDAPELLPPLVAQQVIEHLKKWCKRCNVDWRKS